MEQIIEIIPTKNPHTPTMTGVPQPFPRGYGRGLYLYSEDGNTRYYIENLSYEDLCDAVKLNIIDEFLQVLSTVVEPPSIIWPYEKKYEVYKRAIAIDPRLPKICLGDYEEKFLEFLAKDIEEHPENVQPVSKELWEHAKQLVQGVEVNLDEPLEDDDDL